MTTITIKVDGEQNAEILEKMLKALSFVNNIEVNSNPANLVEEPVGSYQKIKQILDKTDQKIMFKSIKDPAKWQSEIRNEWERNF